MRSVLFWILWIGMPLWGFSQKVFQDTVDVPFDLVWKAAVTAIEETGCDIEQKRPVETEEALWKAKIASTFCVLATNPDSTDAVFDRYAKRVPYIRGGVWTSARIQYVFYLTELPDGRVAVRLRGRMSGYEQHVTATFHYFASNGQLEAQLFQRFQQLLHQFWREAQQAEG